PYANNAPYAATDEEKNYNAGTYTLDLFNYQYPQANNPEKWLRMNTVSRYSPNGNALEEENILGIKSCAKFGYNKVLPYAIAQNCAYDNFLFESYENTYVNDRLEDGRQLITDEGVVTNEYAHSGIQSLRLKYTNQGLSLVKMPITEQLLDKGLSTKVWVKSSGASKQIDGHLRLNVVEGAGNDPLTSSPFQRIAQTGEWTLFEAKVHDLSSVLTLGETYDFRLYFDFGNAGTHQVWIDDVRMQPMDAQATCYVYDVNSLRLITSFDDQHFGLYYQYNAEGQLVRQLIETERGFKTVQEAQYNTPKVNRQ
ncbi:MAG: hypothetical protein AAFU67_15415, partial [Bacteroidota bacterium]